MSPMYEYEHPETGEIFDVIRSVKDRNKKYRAKDGVLCKRLEVPTKFSGWKGNKEVFEADSDYCKKMSPKYVKFKDGHRERYDSAKHC